MTLVQIFAILAVLSSFGVDQQTVNNIRDILIPPTAQSATISPMQPAQSVPQSNTPTATAPAVSQAQNTPATPATPAQTAPAFTPFVRSGSASATLAEKTTTLPLSGGRIYLATLTIKNDTNETLGLSDLGVNENSFFVVSNSTIKDWDPRLVGIYRNQEFREDRRGIKPGETAEVKFILDSYPPISGTFDLSMSGMKIVGQQTGTFIKLSGFPLTLGTFTVVE